MFSAIDTHPDATESGIPSGHIDIVSNAIEAEALSARPGWPNVGHFG
jgi:hypothetical protein